MIVLGKKYTIALLGLFAVASCAGIPSVTRANFQPQALSNQDISAISRRFQREVPATVNFGFDEDTLSANASAILDQQADWILRFPEIRFSVYGHTDKVGSSDYNQELGLRRATRVVDYLVSKGINADRLEALVTYGEEKPLINTESRELANRRASTTVSGFFAVEAADRGKSESSAPVVVALIQPDDSPPTADPEPPVGEPLPPKADTDPPTGDHPPKPDHSIPSDDGDNDGDDGNDDDEDGDDEDDRHDENDDSDDGDGHDEDNDGDDEDEDEDED